MLMSADRNMVSCVGAMAAKNGMCPDSSYDGLLKLDEVLVVVGELEGRGVGGSKLRCWSS
jgi:hypothetical protein